MYRSGKYNYFERTEYSVDWVYIIERTMWVKKNELTTYDKWYEYTNSDTTSLFYAYILRAVTYTYLFVSTLGARVYHDIKYHNDVDRLVGPVRMFFCDHHNSIRNNNHII